MKKSSSIIIGLFIAFMCLPLAATLVYSFSTEWGKSLLPSGFTCDWYAALYRDPAFLMAVLHSLLLTVLTLAIVLIILVPSIVLIALYLPKYDRYLKATILLPYAIPGVILATALMRTYTDAPIPLLLILSGGLFIYSLPFMYQSVRSSLREIDGIALLEAAELLGASKWRALLQIIFPNIRIGIMVGSLLTFSAFFGEFQLTNMILGGQFETIRIYMLRVMQINGHLASAVVITYLLLLGLIGGCIVRLTHLQKRRVSRGTTKQADHEMSREGCATNELLDH
ncbi:MAG: ABC transporter permease subunit [Sporolactobacillus sp.]